MEAYSMSHMPTCVGCGALLTHTLIDLGMQPLANAYILPARGHVPDRTYPLHVRVCGTCLLVQVEHVTSREDIFSEDYAYFSSYSEDWLAHCKNYVDTVVRRFGLNSNSEVIEIASNDGYMLQYMIAAGVPSLGIEPAASVAHTARARGVPTEITFFGKETAQRLAAQGHFADLIASKNVLAHVPDINDFVAGLRLILKPEGVYTVEFPHLLNLIQHTQFDTIYHEHFTYLSVGAIQRIFSSHGLRIFDIQEFPTHGGSLRVYACNMDAKHVTSPSVAALQEKEKAAGLNTLAGYAGFSKRAEKIRTEFLAFLDNAEKNGKQVVGYGAAAKGNTFFNYCGITADRIPFVCDLNPAKQGKLLPGSHIPIKTADAIAAAKPDYVLILPWNLRSEISGQLSFIRAWGGLFVTAIPEILVS
jgi:SAM-dependent methyltransferase